MSGGNICIIPARGGSKRLPRKNILLLNGKPMIAYTIEAAINCGLFNKVCVSTEDEEIKEIALKYSAEVPYTRPQSLATDGSTVLDVCLDMLSHFEKEGVHFDSLCCLYATAALRTSDDIVNSYNVLKKGFTSVMAVSDFSFSPHQAMVLTEDNRAKLYWEDLGLKKSQEVPDFFVDNGSTYWIKAEKLKTEKGFYTDNTGVYKMPKIRSIDLDTEEDYELLKKLAGPDR